MKYVPKEITEEVNVTPTHPLVNFAYLIGTVALSGVVIYGVLGVTADQIVQRIGPDTEEKIGATLVRSLPFQSETPQKDSRLDYLATLTSSIQKDLEKSGFDTDSYPPIKVGIMDTPAENAMVTAGSYLFVTEGLLAEVKSENELAFVLAHEIGHLQNRDALTALGRSLVWLTINGLLGIGQQGSGVLPNAFNLAELNYSRGQETAADDVAIALIQSRYGHGDHSLDFFRRAQENELDLGALNRVAEWQQTHPLSSERIKRIEATFKAKNMPLNGEATPLPKDLACVDFQACKSEP
ncbi:MAG: M48 family metallopeptidase [Cyanobacteria bacterium J06621_11]